MATLSLSVVHTGEYVVFLGDVVTFILFLPPCTRLTYEALSSMSSVAFITLTTQLAFTPLPSVALAHILAFPALMPVTVPLFDTLHTDFLLDFHLSFLFVAVFPETSAVSLSFFPTPTSAVSGSVMVVTFSMTVTMEYAMKSPSSDTHLIRVAPPLIPFISPSSLTVHMLVSSLVQVTSLSEAFEGVIVAVSS